MDEAGVVRGGERAGDLRGVLDGDADGSPFVPIASPSVRPAIRSMTMKSMSPSRPASCTVTMLGWLSAEAAWASRTKRRRPSASLLARPASP